MTRAFDLAAERPWAIFQPALQTILEIADRAPVTEAALAEWKSMTRTQTPEAVALRMGRPLRDGGGAYLRGNVAVLPITGPIFRHANLMTEMSGATATGALGLDLGAALSSAAKFILLEVDSPGGEVPGIADLAAQIRAADARKPVIAYVGGLGASAAYWLASAASRIVVSPTAMLGSIGVVSTLVERDGAVGVRRYEFVSSQSPEKRLSPATEEGRQRMQSLVDRLATEFVSAVASYRGVGRETVLTDFGRGGVLVGTDAVAAGMADEVGTFEALMSDLGAGSSTHAIPIGAAAASETEENQMTTKTISQILQAAGVPALTAEAFAAEYPALAEGFRAEGAAAERARIAGIDALALPGHETLLAALKADGRTTPDQAASAILAAEKQQRGATMAAMAAAGASPAAPAPVPLAPTAAAPVADDQTLPLEDRAKAAWDTDPAVRAEFLSYEGYVAFRRADEAGLVKMLTKNAA